MSSMETVYWWSAGVLVALVGDFDESRSIDIEGELFGLWTFLCRLVSVTGCGLSRQVSAR